MVFIYRSSFLVLLALLFGNGILMCQEESESYQFGEVDLADLQMTVYDKDSSATALILLDYAFLGYDHSRKRVSYKTHIQIKILKQEAFDLADVSIPYVGKGGILNVKAATHNLVDGAIETTTLTDDNIIEEKIQARVRIKKISFPGVVEGSILEYSYELLSLSPWQFLPWYFQSQYPVRKSDFWLAFPGSRDLYPRLYGDYSLSVYSNELGYKHHLVMEDVPAFVQEPFVNAIDDHYAKVNFEYVSRSAASWELLTERIMEYKEFGSSLARLNQLKGFYPKDKKWKPDKRSLQEIHTYVKNHFEWNEALSMAFTDRPKKVWELGKGTSSDINLMLLMFLRKAGFQADPVFLSTKNYGVINPHYPTFNQFNTVVIQVPLGDEKVLLDATGKHRSYDVLPDYCLNDSGLVIKPGPQEWISMHTNKEKSIRAVSVQFEIDDLESISGSGSVNYGSSAAANARVTLSEKDQSGMEEEFKTSIPGLELDSLAYTGVDDPYENLKASFKFSSESMVDVVGDKLFFSPVIWPEIEKNPFKAVKRVLPVDFPMAMNRRYFFNVTIPEGYSVEELPRKENFVLPNGGGSYTYLCEQQGGVVQVMIRFQLNRFSFLPSEYPGIRELFNLIIAKQEEKVVLIKK